MPRELVIGLDLGTTSVKACLFDSHGNVITEVEEMNETSYPEQGFAEQNVYHIETATIKAISQLMSYPNLDQQDIVAISFSAAMHSLLCVSKAGEALSPVMIWADGRSTRIVNELSQQQKKYYYERTGTPVHPMTPFTKLLWMKETNYKPYLEADYYMSVKEFLLYRWFGVRHIDYAMASATGLYQPTHKNWDPELLQLTKVAINQLSEIVPPTTFYEGIKPQVAEAMGLTVNIPFVIGSADGQLSNLGSGALQPGEVAISVGTSGAIRQFTSSFQTSPSQETFCYAFDEQKYIVGGPTNNGGVVLQWLKQLISFHGDIADLIEEGHKAPIGAEGLVFLPYINGERAPLWNQDAVGNFYGLSMIHEPRHMIRAVLEGITYNLYQIGCALEHSLGPAKKIYVNGGLSRSQRWLQMLSDVFNAEIIVSETHNGAAWGAAWTALVALSIEKDFESIKSHIPYGARIVPNQDHVKQYNEHYNKYKKVQETVIQLYR